MIRQRKESGKKKLFLLMGISLSLVFFVSGTEAASSSGNIYHKLSFGSILTPNNVIDVDGLFYLSGKPTKNTKNTTTSPSPVVVTKDKKKTSAKKDVIGSRNSTSLRSVIIVD